MNKKDDGIEPKDEANMTSFEKARWLSLAEAVELITEKATDRGMKEADVDYKPSAILKYIEGTCDNICRGIDEMDANAFLRKEEDFFDVK